LDLAHREYLWLLALVPPLMAWVGRGRRRSVREWSALGQDGRLRDDGALGGLAAAVCLILALAQPRWGRVPSPPLPPGRDVVLLVDTSRSMGVADALPDRLGVAVEAAVSLVQALAREPAHSNRAALVAFAGRGVLRCPLTENLTAVVDALYTLKPGDVRPGGTDLGAALDAAEAAFDDRDHAAGRTIVLFSDGEDHVGTWEGARARLGSKGILVHAVSVGDSEQDHVVPSGRGTESLSYQGAPVLSRRTDRPLEAVAIATGGAFVPLGLAPMDLGAFYLNRIEPVARQKREGIAFRGSERAERYSWFVLLALGLGLGAAWPGRRGWTWRRSRREPAAGRRPRWAGLVVATLAVSIGAAVPRLDSPAAAVDAGRSAYQARRWPEALAAFDRAIELDHAAAVPRYDAGATLFQMQRYDAAQEHYRAARGRAGPALRTRIDYALGNTSLALGDIAGAIRHYDACIVSTAAGIGLDEVRRDAAINRRFAEESAQKSPAPSGGEGEPSGTPRSHPPGSKRGDGASPEARPPASDPGSSGRDSAGGHSAEPSRSPSGTPEQRLDEALRRIRDARQQREDESPPPAVVGDPRKDW
jgi:Ca-activated chloride channel family protein